MDLLGAFKTVTSWGSTDGDPADLFDRLTYRITTLIMLLIVAIIGLKSYVFQPIQCTLTESYAGTPTGFEEYAENMCWIENIFSLRWTEMNSGIKGSFEGFETDLRSKIRLYQWTPIVLAIQAFCCFLPYMLWTAMQQRAGINLGSIIGALMKASVAPEADERNKQIEFAARSLDECLLMQREYRSGCSIEVRRCLGKLLPCFAGKRSGCLLTIGYICLKTLFILMPLLQIWFMSRYIGTNSMFFGYEIFINCTLNLNGTCDHKRDGHWASTGLFPLRAGCLVPVHWNHGKDVYWDCALPINFILEKVYVFLWGWFALILVLNIYSFSVWLYKLFVPGKRRHFVKKFLRLLDAEEFKNKHARHAFIDKYIRLDGLLVLRLVSEIVGDMAAARILLSMWKRYIQNWHKNIEFETMSKRRASMRSSIEMNPVREEPTPSAHSKASLASNGSTAFQNPSSIPEEKLALVDNSMAQNTERIPGYPQV